MKSSFHIFLDGVLILPECSGEFLCNTEGCKKLKRLNCSFLLLPPAAATCFSSVSRKGISNKLIGSLMKSLPSLWVTSERLDWCNAFLLALFSSPVFDVFVVAGSQTNDWWKREAEINE